MVVRNPKQDGKSRGIKMNCAECGTNIDDEKPIVIEDKRLPTCNECYEG